MSLTEAARMLVTCQHPARVRVVAGQAAEWCERCGSIYDGERWERPHEHAVLLDAVRASDRLRHAPRKAPRPHKPARHHKKRRPHKVAAAVRRKRKASK